MVMNPQQLVLWSRLEAFCVGPTDAALPFESRLARENGWTREDADRVMREYRRFLLLTQIAGHAVTPSEQVDAAWHLHMCYTRSYWDDLCGRVLGKPLHHDPTEGGDAEQTKFVDWYERTLASYERVFGEKPPRDIWLETSKRFNQPEMPSHRRQAIMMGVFFLAAGGVAATMAAPRHHVGVVPTWLIIVGFATLLAVLVVVRNWKTPKKRGGRMKPDGKGGYVWASGCGSGCVTGCGEGIGDGCGSDGGSGCGSGCGGGGCGGGGD